MNRVGIMGGTFDPIHNAHLKMAYVALEQADVCEVWFMPSKNPPHKPDRQIVSEQHRSEMVKLAIQGEARFLFSDYELRREGITYTAETLLLLKKEYPETHFCFIVGGDSFFQLETWRHPEVILENTQLLAIPGGRADPNKIQAWTEHLQKSYRADILLLDMADMPISSSQIRKNIRQGYSVRGMLPERVERYIRQKHLYRSDTCEGKY